MLNESAVLPPLEPSRKVLPCLGVVGRQTGFSASMHPLPVVKVVVEPEDIVASSSSSNFIATSYWLRVVASN